MWAQPKQRAAPGRALALSWRPAPPGSSATIFTAWLVITALSTAPFIVARELFRTIPAWLTLAQIALAAGALVISLVVSRVRAIWRFCAVMLAMLIVFHLTARADLVGSLQIRLGAETFTTRMLAEQAVKLAVALVMIVVLLALGYRPREFFLRAGDRDARIRPAPLLGFPRADSWRRFGLIWGFGIALVLGAVQFVIIRPTSAQLAVLPALLPAVLLIAALNALAEELTYRAPMLASLEPAVGSTQALWGSAVFFGVAHYFGIPGGLVGAAASVFMGWLLSKAMLETRGLFWPWFIHFLSDVVIFSSVAVALS